ncbi:MAG: hypothetical protein L6V82_06650 [Clostridiales bacterium]|nr:MAG: hypothetical protein L6V82_06650 [Clostridiales bacterium]
MKKVILVILTVIIASVLAFSLTACNSNVATDKLLRLNWCDGGFTETFTYSVSGKVGETLVTGTLTLTIKPAGSGYVIERQQTMDDGTTINGSVSFSKSGSFLPSESVLTTEKGGVKTTQKVVYDGKKSGFIRRTATRFPKERRHPNTIFLRPTTTICSFIRLSAARVSTKSSTLRSTLSPRVKTTS